ncbi:Quinate permease [Colletotrichum trifolii]|uniref:Quinate permease n=1 Tax=Colletotrichum trifolii TaxID=5466 RepID=A0A4R8QDC6_COLTR|nr:Quinate permease [Colletotrichum trifolii]
MGFFSTHASGTHDPPQVRNWRIHLIALVASMSALAMGYDTAVIGGTMALDSFRRDFHLDDVSTSTRDTIQGNIVSTFQAGCFFGALFTFPIAEKFGRRKTVMLAGTVFLLGGTLMTAARGSLNMIYAGRAVAGLGIGASSLTVPVYIAETAPPSIRGRLVGIFEIASQGGGMLGFWINYATDRTINVNSQAQWVIPLALQLVPGLGLALGMIWCPESPRWLARGDHFEAAERILTKIRGLPSDHEYIRREMNDIRTQVEQRTNNRLTKKQMFQKLFQKGIRNRLGLGMALMFLQSFTGVNIITYYAPRIFETLGITGTSTKLFSTGFYGIAKTFGMVMFTFWVAERVGRRKGLLWGSALGCIPMWYIGGYVSKNDPATAAAAGVVSRSGWGYLAMACVYINGVIICATWQGVTWLYASEIQTLEIRMLAVSITTATTWLGSFIIARTTPYMISDLGYGAYFFFASILMLMGLTLEDMDILFRNPTHKTVWAQMKGRDVVAAGRRSPSISDEKLEANIEAAQVETKS